MSGIQTKACAKPECDNFGKRGQSIGGHGWFRTKRGTKRRYRCKICGGTVSTNTGTAYFGLRCTRSEFDRVASMRVEGVSISAIDRTSGHSRGTVDRWLQRAATSTKRFNDEHLREFEIEETQADELCTFVGNKTDTRWLFTLIEVSSRLWPSKVLGRRSYRNTELLCNETVLRGKIVDTVLAHSDGFEFYERVIRAVLGVGASTPASSNAST